MEEITKLYKTYNPKLKPRARELRKNMTLSEVLLWEKLKNRRLLNYKFRRQVPIGKYVVDFYCKEISLALEIDGISHDFKIERDKIRTKSLIACGVQILRFNDLEVKKQINNVVQQIVDWIVSNPPRSLTRPPRPSGE